MNREKYGKRTQSKNKKRKFQSTNDFYKEAIYYKRVKDLDLAIFYFEKTLLEEENFKNAEKELNICYLDKANKLVNNCEYNKAIGFYNKSLKFNPKSYITLYYKAKALYFNNQEDEGFECLKKAYKLCPKKNKVTSIELVIEKILSEKRLKERGEEKIKKMSKTEKKKKEKESQLIDYVESLKISTILKNKIKYQIKIGEVISVQDVDRKINEEKRKNEETKKSVASKQKKSPNSYIDNPLIYPKGRPNLRKEGGWER